jgi:large subunit ribosomal protein L6
MSFSKIIPIPANVSLFWQKNQFIFQGPLGILNFCPEKHAKGWAGFRIRLVDINNNDSKTKQLGICIENPSQTLKNHAFGHTLSSLLQQKLVGVSQGYFLTLEIRGIGYRVSLNGQKILFKLGYSHEIQIDCPPNLRVFSPKPNLLCIYSIDFSELTQFCESIKRFKKPEPYKGKGIRFYGQEIPLRIGKKK